MGKLVDYNEIGDEVVRSLGLSGKDGQVCKRMVRAYVYRLGYSCQYGARYEGDGILLMPYISSIKKRMMKDTYWVKLFNKMKYRHLRNESLIFYFNVMKDGFKIKSALYKKRINYYKQKENRWKM